MQPFNHKGLIHTVSSEQLMLRCVSYLNSVKHLFGQQYLRLVTLMNLLSRPDLREHFYSLFWLGQGVTRVGTVVFVFLCWPGMVPNQRQLFSVVSDWGSYLGSLFPTVVVGSCLCLVACEHYISFPFSVCFTSNKRGWNHTTLHLDPIHTITIVTLILCSRCNPGSSIAVVVLMRASFIIALDCFCDYT